MIGRLCVIGVGLMGGSLALALRRAAYVEEIVGCSRDSSHLDQALSKGIIDRAEIEIAAAVKGADVIVLAVPLGAVREVLEHLKDHVAESAVITDVGSAKASVIDDLLAVYGEIPENVVPGHPIAGNEKCGVAAAIPDLFHQRRVIITPLKHTSTHAVEVVSRMWSAAGAMVETMDVEHHDKVLAATSHLPHMLAFSLVDTLARLEDEDEIFRYAAGGFRDFTRIASSDPVMWRDICIANRAALLEMLERFMSDLAVLTQAVADSDKQLLLDIFRRAKASRDEFCH